MRSRNSSNFSAMDPIQKMEILESYPYMLHGLSQPHVPNQTHNDDTAASSEIIKTEPFDASDEVVVNVNGNGDTGSGGKGGDDVNGAEKSNEQTTENAQSPSEGDATKSTLAESNGGAGASDANSNGAKRRKCSATDATATSSSEENGDGKGKNDDYHFLMSMQPFMSELSLAQKLRLRMKIQKLVFDELYGCYNDLRT